MAGDSGRDRKRPPARSRAADDRQAGSVLRRLGRIAAGCLTGFVILSLLLTMLYRVAPPPVTPLMLLRSAEGYGIRKNWRPLDDISPALIRAVIASEDQRFCRHFGFDWSAIYDNLFFPGARAVAVPVLAGRRADPCDSDELRVRQSGLWFRLTDRSSRRARTA